MIVVSVASGTSVDACDVAAVDIDWVDDAIVLRVLGIDEYAFPAGLASRVLATLAPNEPGMAEVCRLDSDLGRTFADAAANAIAGFCAGSADLIVSPGQTVFHDVVDGECHGTLQIGQPAWIAQHTGVPVVSDLRAGDVAAGGHGAPLASTFDALWLAGFESAHRTAALNLGGIANVSIADDAGGLAASFDTGPANCLLDIAAAEATDGELGYDADGRLATAGRVDDALLQRLLAHPYFRRRPPKSTGRELFSAEYLARARDGTDVFGPDLLATLTELTARTVAEALRPYDARAVVASGGGVRNPALLSALRRCLAPATLRTSAEVGVDPDAKESLLWALLGFLTWHGVAGTVRSGDTTTTGATQPRVLGRITPGAAPLRLPEPVTTTPRALYVR